MSLNDNESNQGGKCSSNSNGWMKDLKKDWMKYLAIIGAFLVIFYVIITSPLIYPILLDKIGIINVKLVSPVNEARVENSFQVKGSISVNVPDGQYMWIAVNPIKSPGLWYPQGSESIMPYYGSWCQDVVINGSSGDKFYIAVFFINYDDNKDLINWIENAKKTGSYKGISLPNSAVIKDKIAVIMNN